MSVIAFNGCCGNFLSLRFLTKIYKLYAYSQGVNK